MNYSTEAADKIMQIDSRVASIIRADAIGGRLLGEMSFEAFIADIHVAITDAVAIAIALTDKARRR